jgi:hypothetical protein
MDNVIQKFVTPEGHEQYGIFVASILDNVINFGGNNEWCNSHPKMWATSNCSIETVCASAMVIYKEDTSCSCRFWCQCCQQNVHSSSMGQYNTLHDIMVAIPSVSITHRLARRLQLVSTRMVKENSEDFLYQSDYRLYPKHLHILEKDTSIKECNPDSSKPDNIVGDDSLLLSALKNDVGDTS